MASKTFVRGVNFVFTINNPTEDDEELITSNVGDDDTSFICYVIYGHEEGDGGTYHLQGFCQLHKQKTLRQVKKIFPRAHIEKVLGTQLQAIQYCKKDGHFDEYGKLRKHGGKGSANKKRYDMIKKDIIEDKRPLREVILECENGAQIKFAEMMEKYGGLEEKTHDVSVYWYYGPTGCGKSHTAFSLINKKSYWMSANDLKWFDGYSGQEDVLIDDFRGSFCNFAFLLRLLDKYPLNVPVKGSFVRWCPKRIFITCPFHPKDCYNGIEDKSQLIRRITEIKHFAMRFNVDGTSQTVDDDIPEPTLEVDGYQASNFDSDVY